MRATQIGDATLVQMLLAHGAKVNAQDDNGNTALMFAAQKGQARIARLLLDKGATLAMRNGEGATALTFAQSSGHAALVRVLSPQLARQSPAISRPSLRAVTTQNPAAH